MTTSQVQAYRKILSDRLELLADVCVILRVQPTLLHHLQRLLQHLRWSHCGRIRCLKCTINLPIHPSINSYCHAMPSNYI